jgi:hypothetical protein
MMSRQHWRSALFLVCVGVIFAGAGCSGDGLPRQPVSGFVTLGGQPLSSGAITLYPEILDDPEMIRIMGGAMIKDGYFSIPRSQGLVPGRYDIAINSASMRQRRRRRDREPGNDQAVEKERIPAKYNTQTHLAIDIKNAAIKEVIFHLESD